jgi:dihydroorotase
MAETRIVERDIRLAEKTACSIHIQHVSSAGSVELIRKAAANGLGVSAEATPHHLALTEADIDPANANFKMNPPLRTEPDRQAILSAVADGTIAVLATDHAPHRKQDKDKGFLDAPFGIVGLETAIGITYTLLVKSGMMDLVEWVKRWTTGPARVLHLAPPGLEAGAPANISILDLRSEWTARSKHFLSRSGNTPFEGRRLTGQAVTTLLDGKMTWNTHKAK